MDALRVQVILSILIKFFVILIFVRLHLLHIDMTSPSRDVTVMARITNNLANVHTSNQAFLLP